MIIIKKVIIKSDKITDKKNKMKWQTLAFFKVIYIFLNIC